VPDYEVETTTLRIGGVDTRIRALRDRLQYDDDDGRAERVGISSAAWPIFGVIWPAGVALAEVMAAIPIEGRRILEVGCGLGLASLVLARRGADVTASDHHPLAEEFLRENAALNGLPPIAYRDAPWAASTPDLGRFDLIVGSDLLYEPDQPALLAGFLARHAAPAAEVIVADPGRSRLGAFGGLMAAQGYARTEPWPRFVGTGGPARRGRTLRFVRAAPHSV
jgi:predicted nicotinamide N-methyase